MKKLQFTWKKKTGAYQTGESLYLNRIRLAGFYWNSSRSQGDKEAPNWAGEIELPSLKNNRIYGYTEAKIKAGIEHVITIWFREATNETLEI